MRTLTAFMSAVVLVCTLCPHSHAQQPNATLSGTVTDPNGALIPGATVTATNNATSAARTTTTNGEGLYVLSNLSPGGYEIRVKATGFDEKVTAVADALSLNRGTITIRTINQTGDTLDYAFRWNTVFADAHWSVGRSADTRTEDVGDNGLIPFPKGLHVYFDTNSKLAEFVRKTIKESGIDCSPAEHKNNLGTNLELLVGNQ